LEQKLQRNNKEVKIKVNKPSYEKDRGKPSSETRKENPNQLGTQPQHAFALFETSKEVTTKVRNEVPNT